MRRIFLLVFFVATSVLAASQESSDGKSIAQANQKAEQNSSPPKNEPASVDKGKTEPANGAAKNEADHAAEKLDLDRKLVDYTGELSRFTKWLVVVTAALALIGVWQGFLLGKSIALGRKEFIATHRPKLRVRKLMGKNREPITDLKVEITNVGDSDAEIIESHAQIVVGFVEYEAINKFNDSEPNNPISLEKIAAGESVGMNALKFTAEVRREKLILDGGGGFGNLYAIGWVRYRDKNGTVRRTGFCRRRDPNTGLYHPTKDVNPDYEYED